MVGLATEQDARIAARSSGVVPAIAARRLRRCDTCAANILDVIRGQSFVLQKYDALFLASESQFLAGHKDAGNLIDVVLGRTDVVFVDGYRDVARECAHPELVRRSPAAIRHGQAANRTWQPLTPERLKVK